MLYNSCAILFLILGIFIGKCKSDDGIDLNIFRQHDYQFKYERTELVRYNKSLIDASIVTFKYNRTTAVTNITLAFKTDIGFDELTAIAQGYKFMSNEYRHFPVRFSINVCKSIRANVAGSDGFMKCGNYTGCPNLKGVTQRICNWFPDSSPFPPLIPNGEYKAEIQFLVSSQELMVVNGYGTVSRPIPYI